MLEKILIMQNKVFIKEIFESIQGEGPYIGVNQLFIRFSSCNLNCSYCDTDFKSDLKKYSVDDLLVEIEKYKNIHSISLTGGEPLLNMEFLKELLTKTTKKIYLETNGTLFQELSEIVDYVDIISMDIKLPSVTGIKNLFDKHKKFIENAKEKELFLKVVFDEKITDDEILTTVQLAKEKSLLIVLQPKMDGNDLNIKTKDINQVYYKFISLYSNVRLIPQVHKFLDVR